MSQPAPERITNSRLTLVSGQVFLEHEGDWQRGLPNHPWMATDFTRIFQQLRGGSGHIRYAFPWRDSQRSGFWRAYCGASSLGQVSAESAWELLVPLRLVPTPRPAVRAESGARVFYDIYGYPFGLVATLTIQLPSGAPSAVGEWREAMRALRMGSSFRLTPPGGAETTPLSAGELLSALLDWHRGEFFGPIATYTASAEEFSVAAVIQGDGVDPLIDLAARPDLQRTLNAVTAWPLNWQAARPPELVDARLPASSTNSSVGDALYAARRGRTLWRPGLFTYRAPPGARLHTLSCLAHNLVAGSVQAEALRLFAMHYATLDKGRMARIPVRLRAAAAKQIERLWYGRETYRSSSVQRLLQDASSLAQVNALLKEMELEPLPA